MSSYKILGGSPTYVLGRGIQRWLIDLGKGGFVETHVHDNGHFHEYLVVKGEAVLTVDGVPRILKQYETGHAVSPGESHSIRSNGKETVVICYVEEPLQVDDPTQKSLSRWLCENSGKLG